MSATFVLGKNKELLLYYSDNVPLVMNPESEPQVFPSIFEGSTRHLKFVFLLNHRPLILLSEKKYGTSFTWDNSKGLWRADTNNEMSWYLHFRGRAFSFASPGNLWFYQARDGNMVYDEFIAGNALLHVDNLGILYNPSLPRTEHLSFSRDGNIITGFLYSDLGYIAVETNENGEVVLSFSDAAKITLRHPTTIPPASNAVTEFFESAITTSVAFLLIVVPFVLARRS